ncbi:TIR domain-containing protein, partial [Streptomyces flavofungini]|uniref:TIR domain-containing protein n=1 Tax=Streptomyces flavofungini TaxID=68200 RepID=UPI0034E0403B
MDDVPAAAFQAAVEHFGRPFYRSRDLRTFRDKTNLTASPHLWRDIEKALSESAWLIVMASPKAADSPWVCKEIQWWLDHRDTGTMLFAWTAGTIAWDAAAGDFDWESTDALPKTVLTGAFAYEPRWVDLTWLRDHKRISPRHDRLVQAVAEFVAPIRGRSKADLIGAHLRRQLRFRQTVTAISVVLAILLGVSVVAGVRADRASDRAAERQLTATSRQLVAEAASIQDTQPDLARQLLVQAYRLSPTAQAAGALIASAAIPDVLRTSGFSGPIGYSHDGKLLASASDDGVTLYDTGSNRRLGLVRPQGRSVTAVAFSPQGRRLAVGDGDGYVRLWDVATPGKPRRLGTVRPDDGDIEALAFSARGARLALISGAAVPYAVDVSDPRHPEVTDSAPGTPLSGIYDSVAVSPDGSLVAASYEAGKVKVYRLSKRGRLTEASTRTSPSNALTFSPDGQFLVACGDEDTARVWDVSDPDRPEQAASLSALSSLGIGSVAFNDQGTTLATGAGDGTIQLWDVSDPLRPAQGARLTGHSGSVHALAFAPDGRTLASSASDGATLDPTGTEARNGSVRLWSVDEAQRSSSRVFLPSGHISGQPFSRDGNTLVGGLPSTLWWVGGDARPGRLATLSTFNVGGQRVSFSPDGRRLATGSPLKLWDASDPARPKELKSAQPKEGSDTVVFSPDGALVAVSQEVGLKHGVGLWKVDGSASRRLSVLPVGGSTDLPLTFLGDGTMLATLTKDANDVQIWDIADPARPERAATVRLGAARPTALAAAGRLLLTGDSHGAVTAWRVTGTSTVTRLGT